MDKGEKKRSGGGLTQSDRLYTNNMNVFILNVIKFERPIFCSNMCEKYVAVPADKTPKYIIRMAKISRCY